MAESTLREHGTHDDKSRFWTSKVGEALYTYFDLDQWGYRTAKNILDSEVLT